jgi:hypothetical protein
VVTDTVKLAVEMGRSAVKDQSEQLTDLRSRAGTLLAAASIAGTFAGATHGSIDTLAALAPSLTCATSEMHLRAAAA